MRNRRKHNVLLFKMAIRKYFESFESVYLGSLFPVCRYILQNLYVQFVYRVRRVSQGHRSKHAIVGGLLSTERQYFYYHFAMLTYKHFEQWF